MNSLWIVVIGAVVYGVVATFFYSGWLGVSARGYQDWKATTGSTIADEF